MPYEDLQSLPVSTHHQKYLLMYFVIGLPIFTNWKGDSYDSILIIIDRLMKIVHYELIKITIDTLDLAEVLLDVIIWHHS